MVVCRFDDVLLKILKSNAKEVLAVLNFIKEANDETPLHFMKQSTQPRGEMKDKREDPSPRQKSTNPKWVIRGQMNKLCSRTPTSGDNHIREGKGRETSKHSEPGRTLTCEGNACQNRGSLHFVANGGYCFLSYWSAEFRTSFNFFYDEGYANCALHIGYVGVQPNRGR
jgi:hypothetical protein